MLILFRSISYTLRFNDPVRSPFHATFHSPPEYLRKLRTKLVLEILINLFFWNVHLKRNQFYSSPDTEISTSDYRLMIRCDPDFKLWCILKLFPIEESASNFRTASKLFQKSLIQSHSLCRFFCRNKPCAFEPCDIRCSSFSTKAFHHNRFRLSIRGIPAKQVCYSIQKSRLTIITQSI